MVHRSLREYLKSISPGRNLSFCFKKTQNQNIYICWKDCIPVIEGGGGGDHHIVANILDSIVS